MIATSSITQAISLLTTPLLMKVSPSVVSNLRTILKANLMAPLPISGHIDLHFRLSPYTLPPAPILATCIASGVTWAEWSRALGGQAFDIYITNTTVCLKLSIHDRPLTFWRAPELVDDDCFVPPISKIQHRETGLVARHMLVRPIPSKAPIIRIPQLPTQKTTGLTKLSQSFNPFDMDSESDSDSSVSSRPSSPLSDYSFAATSDDGSFTSISTVSSPEETVPKASFLTKKTFTPVIDRLNKTTTNYLYQGGSTRVMTGGVMLGKSATSNLKSKPAPIAPRPRSTGADSLSWRRKL